jgi:hypothetical protein
VEWTNTGDFESNGTSTSKGDRRGQFSDCGDEHRGSKHVQNPFFHFLLVYFGIVARLELKEDIIFHGYT